MLSLWVKLNLKQKFLGLTIILDINVKMIKPLKFPEDTLGNCLTDM